MQFDHQTTTSKPRSGVALIIVMLVVLAMGVTAGAFAYAMKVEARLAQNTSSGGELTWLGLSGVELAKWVLAQQATIPGEAAYHSLNQFWASGIDNPDLLPDPYEGLTLRDFAVGDGRITVKILDQERKMNINRAVNDKMLLEHALSMTGAESSDTDILMSALIDWTDPDNNSQPGRPAETDDYYSRLNPPYQAKNGPIDDLGELMKVRGMTPAIFFGVRSADGTRRDPRRVGGIGQTAMPAGQVVGFKDLFCAISTPQVNVNTASLGVLTLLLGGDGNAANAAETIIRNRAGPDGVDGTQDDTPAKNPGDVQRLIAGAPPTIPWQSLFAVRSSVFQVIVDTRLGPSHQRYVALIQQQGQNYITLTFRQQ